MLGLLYFMATAVNALSVDAVSTSQVLTAEEMSVSIRDVLFTVDARSQATPWSTFLRTVLLLGWLPSRPAFRPLHGT